ncbi:ornithine carbamoyltransferase [Candidatus Micrarchaeota archaeon]|nr:ornithine carbamoyltransferase [Candidatus Micrarchaeota archaeon]
MPGLHCKDLLCVQDFSASELQGLIDYALKLKHGQIPDASTLLSGKSLGMLFQKPSTRTRVSFEAGMTKLGGHALYLNAQDLQLGRNETLEDTAKTLSRYLDGLMVRLFRHQDAVDLARHASIPVINGLTDLFHPCQSLADALTIQELKGHVAGTKIAFVGNAGDNVGHSLVLCATKLGAHVRVAAPKGYQPSDDVTRWAQQNAKQSRGSLLITESVDEAVADADVVYADTWVSMGQEAEKQKRLSDLDGYQVTQAVMNKTNAAVFMHDLPAYRGVEVAADVIDGPHSVVFDQAENRLWAQNAVLVALLGEKK